MLLPHRGLLWLRAGLLVLAVAATSACSFIVSTSGLFGAPPEPGAVEAGSEAGDSGDDALAAMEGGADGGTDAAFCAALSPPPVFCADFDDERPLTAYGTPGGTTLPTLDRTAALSGTGSLLAKLAATSNTMKVSSSVKHTFGSVPFSTYSVAFAMRMPADVASAYTELTLFRFDAGTDEFSFLVATSSGNILLYASHGVNGVATGTTVATVPHSFSPTSWTNIRIAGALGDAAPTVAFSIDGVEVANVPLPYVPPPGAHSPDLVFGVYYSGVNQPAKTINVDNVVLDFKP
jgi:hypothetical protein